MKDELAEEGFEAHFLSVNAVSADKEPYQENLINKCSYPLLQDKEEFDVWGLHDGGKDDFYIFDPEGKLIIHIPFGGDVDTNLTTEDGFNTLKTLIQDAIESN